MSHQKFQPKDETYTEKRWKKKLENNLNEIKTHLTLQQIKRKTWVRKKLAVEPVQTKQFKSKSKSQKDKKWSNQLKEELQTIKRHINFPETRSTPIKKDNSLKKQIIPTESLAQKKKRLQKEKIEKELKEMEKNPQKVIKKTYEHYTKKKKI